MLRLIDVALARGARTLYRGVSLIARPGERVGLVGANGCGKSTLFAAILGELGLEAGSMEAPPPERIAHVAQDIDVSGQRAIDYVLAGHAPLTAARAELAAAEASHDEMRLAHAHAALAELNEGSIVAKAATVMHGLGFATSDGDRPVTAFSGGWRNRLALARALLRPADLLLLDEPTNHLDLDSVVWLESWLRRQPATVLVISHDREFLDRIAETIWHVDNNTIRRYAGDYSAFELAWLEQQKQQDAAAKAYSRTAAHLQQFVDRFRAQATKARQAQSRLKMLERLTVIEPTRARREWRFEFPEPVRVPERLLDAEDMSLGYGERTVLADVTLTVRAGDRIGILGVNGAGKSTLVKAIARNSSRWPVNCGAARASRSATLRSTSSTSCASTRPRWRTCAASRPRRANRSCATFSATTVFPARWPPSLLGPMSGGEKARCALALIAWQRPNLLLLDEPTNHLDMETREALTMALSSYEGALLLVSHDRHLLRATCDQLWLVHDGRVAPFDGDLDDYSALVLASRRDRTDAATDADGPNRREQRKQEAAARQRLAAQPPSAAVEVETSRGRACARLRRTARTRCAAGRPGLLSLRQ